MENHLSVFLRSEPHQARGVTVQNTLSTACSWHVRQRLLCYVRQGLLVLGSPRKEIPLTGSRLRVLGHLEKRFQTANTLHEFPPGKVFIAVLVCLSQEPLEEGPESLGYFREFELAIAVGI